MAKNDRPKKQEGISAKHVTREIKVVADKMDANLNSVKAHLSDEVSKHMNGARSAVSQLGADIDKKNSDVLSKLKSYEDYIGKLENKIKQHESISAKLDNDLREMTVKLDSYEKRFKNLEKDTLHVGKESFIPPQPTPKQESGVYKDAPLSLSVNGGLVLHNIGYTNKKGYDLTMDKDTGRVMLYHGK